MVDAPKAPPQVPQPLSRTEEALIRFVNLPFAVAMPVLLALITAIGWALSHHCLHSASLTTGMMA